jgi:hypothetical protein
MRHILDSLFTRFERRGLEREVEEELQFHLDMRAQEFELDGAPESDAMTKARTRFGDFDGIKNECVEIASHKRFGTRLAQFLFTLAFVIGILIRIRNPELHLTRIGDVLIMIGIFGGVLLAGKRFRHISPATVAEPLKLGLRSESIPHAFDKDGRTPFERVAADD